MTPTVSGFHIEPTNICTLKCPGCARTQLINQWPQQWKNHSLDIDLTLKFLDIDLTNKQVLLCGNYGDPIYHPEFIEFVQKFKARGAILSIVTNGSYRTSEWWQELVNTLTDQDQITFSIDGLPATFTQYRINANWESIQTGISIAVNSKVQTQWKYIPFAYNQTDIADAEKLSNSLGIDQFSVWSSDRFDETTNYLKPDDEFLGTKYNAQSNWKSTQQGTVNPKCQNNNEHYITATGHYIPCCYIGDHRFYYKTQFGKNKKEYSIADQTLSQLLTAPTVVEFYQTVGNQPGCQFNCPG